MGVVWHESQAHSPGQLLSFDLGLGSGLLLDVAEDFVSQLVRPLPPPHIPDSRLCKLSGCAGGLSQAAAKMSSFVIALL